MPGLVWSQGSDILERNTGHLQHPVASIGGHLVLYPWWAISDWAWYRNVWYRTKERRVRHYTGYRNKLLSDIRYPTLTLENPRSAVLSFQILVLKVVGSQAERKIVCKIILLGSLGNDLSILDIGISDTDLVRYRNGSWCQYQNYSDIGWKDLVRHFLFRYRNKRCRCRISPTSRPMSMPTYGCQIMPCLGNVKPERAECCSDYGRAN